MQKNNKETEKANETVENLQSLTSFVSQKANENLISFLANPPRGLPKFGSYNFVYLLYRQRHFLTFHIYLCLYF